MAASIVDTITQSMSSGLISKLSATTGEPASNIETGLSAAIRAMTASVAMRTNDPDAMDRIHAVAIDPANDLSFPDRAESLVSRMISGSSPATSPSLIQSLLLSNRISNISDSLATHAGVSTATAKSLLAIATSLVMSSLGKMIRADHLDPAALSSRLAADRESIVAGLPAELSKFYPSAGATPRDVAATLRSETPVAADAAATEYRQRESPWRWAVPAALAALAIFALASFFGQTREREYARDVPEPSAVGTSGVVVRHELPGGMSLRAPANGTEARLLAFIRGSGPLTNDNWFEFDRVYFQTDSAVLRSDSMEQLSNVAAILKAHPTASAKIGGYTDDGGDRATNIRLSQMRADAVRDQLQKLGIDGKQLTAEGYGDQHPIADNNMAKGRAKNRRVAIQVTSR